MSKLKRQSSKSTARKRSARGPIRIRSFIRVNIPVTQAEIEVFDQLIETLGSAAANDNLAGGKIN
jgi:hypothetical protein